MRRFAPWLAALVLLGVGRGASAYEFEVRARTIGQALDLRLIRPLSNDILVGRRRLTQTLSLDIWRVGDGSTRNFSLYKPNEKGVRLSFSTYLRVDHDFGDFTMGQVGGGMTPIVDAIDLVPELEENSLALDVLWAHASIERLLGGHLDLILGRQLSVGTLDWWSMDGLTVRARAPKYVKGEVFAGLRVRDRSILASSNFEPDGSSGGECREYVEGPVPGSGAWRPIDLGPNLNNNSFRNDIDRCPQRRELMPTFGGSIASHGFDKVFAEIAYRRSISPTPGLIGPADRFEFRDVGLYPNESGQAPGWGVNEERVSATVRGVFNLKGGKAQVVPYGGARYSLLHGLLDEAHLGTRARYGIHTLEPELFYSFPTFDGDSIFNIFSTQPYVDLRMTYGITPWRKASFYLRGFARQFKNSDTNLAEAGSTIESSELFSGVQLGGRYRAAFERWLRADLFAEDGMGGRRLGAFASGRWRVRRDIAIASRVSVVRLEEDPVIASLANNTVTSTGVQLGGTYKLHRGIALHLTPELNFNRFYNQQFRIIAILDMAFRPEL